MSYDDREFRRKETGHITGRIAILSIAAVFITMILGTTYCNRPRPVDSETAIHNLAADQEKWFVVEWRASSSAPDRELLLKYRELLLEDQCMRLNAHLAFMGKKLGEEPEPIKLPKNKEEIAAAIKLKK